MRLLLLSDTQTATDNLEESQIMLDELMAAAKRYKPDAIIHAGDVKNAYSPVAVQVVNFWVHATRRITKAGYRFIVLMGNHDRISQQPDSKDWLPVLRAAGAETVSKPRIKTIGDGQVAFVPYSSDKQQLMQWGAELGAEIAQDKPSALIFHCEVTDGTLNAAGMRTGGIYLDEGLKSDRYTVCLGGHIHGYQQVSKNGYYVGSPFCMSWSEANQSKGLVFADVRFGYDEDYIGCAGAVVSQLTTKVPGWYDVDYLAANPSTVLAPGSQVRSRIPVATNKIADTLKAEEQRLLDQYGAEVRPFVIPQLISAPTEGVELTGSSDQEHVGQYVAAKYPPAARWAPRVGVGYLSHKLRLTDSVTSLHQIRFRKIVAKRVLSFDDVEVNYEDQGLVLLSGKNRDWPGHSNGAGKSNFLSLLPLGLVGETLKGQENDAWANERIEGPAFVDLVMTDEKNQELRVLRSRRPHGIRFEKNHVDQSTGLTGKRKQETQGEIERATGYDLKLLQNSVYIDQTIVNSFVSGTTKDRMDLVSKLQNLERFENALKLVSADIKANDKSRTELAVRLETNDSELQELRDELADIKARVEKDWASKTSALHKSIALLVKEHATISATKDHYDQRERDLDCKRHDLLEAEQDLQLLNKKVYELTSRQRTATQLVASGVCPTCAAPTKARATVVIAETAAKLKALNQKLAAVKAGVLALKTAVDVEESAIWRFGRKLDDVTTRLTQERALFQQANEALKQEEQRNASLLSKIKTTNASVRQLSRINGALHAQERQLAIDREMLDFARKACSRDGIPMYLTASICPVLNKSASHYSDLFFDGRIKLHFAVEDGKFNVSVVNSAGSDTISGQSAGEGARCGVVAAFAIRDVAPKTNLLILDEPGANLDEHGARMFARGLLKLKDQFGTIIVTTHSSVIEAELSGEKRWVVEKRKGISRLII